MKLTDAKISTLYEIIKCLPTNCISQRFKEINLSNSRIFQILKVMETSGLIDRERNGREVKIMLTPNGELLKNALNLMTDRDS